MKVHGRLCHPAARDFDDIPIPGSDDPSFSFHYQQVVFEDDRKNSFLVCTNRQQVCGSIVQCYFQKRRDKVAHVRDLDHTCKFQGKITDFARPRELPPRPDPQQGIDKLCVALLDFVGSTGESISRAASKELREILFTAVKVGQQYHDIDAQSLCVFPSRGTIREKFIREQQTREERLFSAFSKNRYCSLLMDAGKMHRSPYLVISICNPSTGLDPLVISVVEGFNGGLNDYQEPAMDAFIKCMAHGVQIVGAVSDHLKAQLSALAHYSDHSVFKLYERMEAKGLRFLGCACHKLNLAVKDFLNDPAAAVAIPIFGDISSQSIVSFDILAEDLKKLSKFLNSKPIQANFDMPCPKFCPTRWTNLINIAVLVTCNILLILTIPQHSPELFLDPTFADIFIRGVTDAAPMMTVLFSGFQRLVHIFEGDHTSAAYVLCTIFKAYELSLTEANKSIYGNADMVNVLFRHIFSRFLNQQEGNLYRLLSLATPEGRLFYRTRFMADRREFQAEAACPFELGFTVDIEARTRSAMDFANDNAQKIAEKFEIARAHLDEIRNAVISGYSSGFESEFQSDDDSEYLSDSEIGQTDEDHLDIDQSSLLEPEPDLVEFDDTLSGEPAITSTCEFGIFTEDLEAVEYELASLCEDLDMNPHFVVPIWKLWIQACLGMDVIQSFGQKSLVQVWGKICASSMFTPLLTIMQRLFAIPASQAFCERGLWHLRRILLPFSVNTGPALALTKLQAQVSFKQERLLSLCSVTTDKLYSLFVYAGETIRDVKSMLEEKDGVSAHEIFFGNLGGEILDDDQLIGELDLSVVYRFSDT
jgi:hypothetical protein